MRSNPPKPLRAPFPVLMTSLLLACTVAPAIADDLSEARRLLKQGQPAEALAKVDAYIASRPREAQGPFLKGLILVEMGRPNEAFVVFSKLNEDHPELPEPYNNLAVLYARERQYDKARTALEMAIRTDPGYAIARENLGDVYARLASESYGQALQLDPANKLTKSKLSRLRELNLSASGSDAGGSGTTLRPSTASSRTTGTAPGRESAAPLPTATTAATRPVAKEPSIASTEILSERPAQKPAEAKVEPPPPPSTAVIAERTAVRQDPERGVEAGGWDLLFSPYTVHYNPDKDHKPVVMLGLNKALEGRWFAGGVVFSNSFGQPSTYVYAGQRYVDPFGFENWYLQWTAGLLYGYVGEYEDKVPLNYKGFSPGLVPSIGYRFNKYVYGELDFLGAAGLMFTVVAPLPKDWP